MQRSLSLLAVVVSSLFGCSSTDQAEALPSDGAGGAETGASGNAGGGSAGTGGVKGTGGSTGSGGAKATGGATGSGGRVGGSGGILAADAGAFCDAAVPGPRADDQEGMPPHGLFAASGSGKVLLLWSAPPEISRFTIYRGTSPGAEDPIPLAENVNGVTYLDATAADDTRFYYRVSAAMPGGSCLGGPLSNEATARPTGADAVAAFGAVVANDNPFTSRSYSPTPIPSYDAKSLPQPIVDEAPEWLSLYAKAWQLAFRDLKQPTRENGFVSNYIDPAFYGHIFQWDTVFMLQFGAYAVPYVGTIGSLDNFYAKQHKDGFICREIDEANGADVFYTGSIADAANPPLYSWAEWRYQQFTGDRSRLSSVLVPIAKHYDWLKRNHSRPNGAYWNTGLGAGEDDLARKGPFSWLDMTAQQAQNALFSAFIATAVDNDAVSAFFVEEYLALATLLGSAFWDPTTSMFTDLLADGTSTHVKTVLAFWPLLSGVGSFDQTSALAAHLKSPAELWRPNVIPVLAADEQGYSAQGNYWNGAVWAPTNYMAVRALETYGLHELASSVVRIYLANMATSFQETGTIWEHYAPESATGEGVRDFVGWSGLGPIALFIESALGIHVDGAAKTIMWRPMLGQRNGIENLAVGSGKVTLVASPVANGSRTLTITTTDPLRVAVDTGSHQGTYAVAAGTRTISVAASSW